MMRNFAVGTSTLDQYISAAQERAAESATLEWEKHNEKQATVDNPERFAKYFAGKAVVRGSVYGIPEDADAWRVWHNYNVLFAAGFSECSGDRPVLMRGSKDVIFEKNKPGIGWRGHQAEWETRVVTRYLRRERFTCFDMTKINKLVHYLFNKIRPDCHYKTYDAAMHELGQTTPLDWSQNYRVCYVRGEKLTPYGFSEWKIAKGLWNVERRLHGLQNDSRNER
jgi:hypothetical protein